jgi:hypothetical protein
MDCSYGHDAGEFIFMAIEAFENCFGVYPDISDPLGTSFLCFGV